jgi:hypothetical protein
MIALVFVGLFFLRPPFESGRIGLVSQAMADSAGTGAACYPSLHSDVDFRWAFAVMTIEKGKRITRPVTQDMVLQSGDRLKMMVELQKRCFVYLFHDDGKSGVKLLFPYTFQQFTQYYQLGHRYYVPRADGWFKLDNNPGQEKFYLVASATRLEGLEKAYVRYSSAVGEAKAAAEKSLLDKIKELGQKRRELCSPAERPVTIGGALRSVKDIGDPQRLDIAAFANEIVSKGFTARTYSIEHQ